MMKNGNHEEFHKRNKLVTRRLLVVDDYLSSVNVVNGLVDQKCKMLQRRMSHETHHVDNHFRIIQHSNILAATKNAAHEHSKHLNIGDSSYCNHSMKCRSRHAASASTITLADSNPAIDCNDYMSYEHSKQLKMRIRSMIP